MTLRLDRNERAVPSPDLVALLPRVPADTLNVYPDATPLEERLAERWKVNAGRVLVTAGGDDAIDRICRLFVGDGRELVSVVPTFEMFPFFADLAGGRVVGIDTLDDPAPRDETLERIGERTGAVAVISPHNPSGLAVPTDRLLELAAALPADVWLIVDLAYVEFAEEDPTARLLECPNVLVIRTLSKAWGLAGARVGYALGPVDTIARLRTAGPPFPLAGASLWLAERALELEPAVTAPYVEAVRRERAALTRRLEGMGASVFPSEANFLLTRLDGAADLAGALEERGIRIRRYPALPDTVRFTLPGDPDLFRLLEDTLSAIERDRPEPVTPRA